MVRFSVSIICCVLVLPLFAATKSTPEQSVSLTPLDPPVEVTSQRYMAALQIGSVQELERFLEKVEQEYPNRNAEGPVMLVLHGQEINSYIVDNYSRYQSVVEKSTELTAKGYVQIEICERWLGLNGVESFRLQPFVKTVEYAPTRLKDLSRQQYSYF